MHAAATEASRPSVTQADAGTWALVAPVFDSHRRRAGLWVEIECAPGQEESLRAVLGERLGAHPPAWLFVVATGATPPAILPVDLRCEQILVSPVDAWSPEPSLPETVVAAVRGAQAELAAARTASWHIVTDPAGAAGNARALADGLSAWQECQLLADLGWDAFMLTGNKSVEKKKAKADQIALTRLLGLVTSDADTEELESLFKSQPKLAFDLLNLVNSPALNLRTPATNFRHAITLLGRRQLQRWLQLLMFTRQTSKGEVNILLWHSAFRGRFMELLCAHLQWSAEAIDQAFMVGVFSLIDVLLNDRLENLLQPLALPERMIAALVEEQGDLGQLLALARAIERRATNQVGALSQRLDLDALTLLRLQLDALFWVESFSAPAGD